MLEKTRQPMWCLSQELQQVNKESGFFFNLFDLWIFFVRPQD